MFGSPVNKDLDLMNPKIDKKMPRVTINLRDAVVAKVQSSTDRSNSKNQSA